MNKPQIQPKMSHHIHMGAHSKITTSRELKQEKLHRSARFQELYRLFHKTITPNWDYKDSEQF